MFDDLLARLERELDVPYPARQDVLRELRGELEAAYLALRARGVPSAEAAVRAAQELELDSPALAALADVHASSIKRAMSRLPRDAREWVEWAVPATAIALPVLTLGDQVPVAHYLRDGGMPVWLVIAVGALALLLELHRAFVWFVVRDHSPAALARHTATPLYLAAGTFLLGVLGTALDVQVVLGKRADGAIDAAAAQLGFRESMACVILGAALAAIIVLVHGALAAGLRAIGIPEVRSDRSGLTDGNGNSERKA
jgi:hypothetical protein